MWWKRWREAKAKAREDARSAWYCEECDRAREQHPWMFEPITYAEVTCGTCRWWSGRAPMGNTAVVEFSDGSLHEMFTDRVGERYCKKHAPDGARDRREEWPIMGHDDVCGEYEEKP